MRLICRVPQASKRTLDIASALTLGLLLSPLLVAVGIVCRSSTGRWTRTEQVTGQYGRTFPLHEFALPSSWWGHAMATTGIGKLPILWHIARGEMAWIGPRPLPVGVCRGSSFQRRAADRPGFICLWWIRQQANIDFETETEADHEYVESASLFNDLAIAARAIWVRALGKRREASSSPKINILDVPIRNVSMDQAVNELGELLESDGPPVQTTFVNADCINLSRRNADYRMLLQQVDWNYADGIGMKLAAQLQGASVRQNINGTDLFPRLLTRMEETRLGVFLLGGEPGVADDLATWIEKAHPGVEVCGAAHGFFEDHEAPHYVDQINQSHADLLLVAFGAPRQDLWIAQHLGQLRVRLAMGVGGLFDFYSGRRKRAPQWIREMGLEWCFRLALEPARLWKRYLVGNAAFLARIGWDTIRNRKANHEQ